MTTEHDKLRKKLEAEEEAKLKARLDQVETRPKARRGRNHRKIGEMVCDTGVKTGYQHAKASFVLRLNTSTGEFIAEHGDVEYVSKSRDALKAKMDQVAKVTLDLKWSRYLLVSYKATIKNNSRWGGYSHITLDDPRKKGMPVFGIELSWTVVEYSNAIELPGQGKRFMKRDVNDDGEASSAQETEMKLPDGLVPYTKEREDVLRRLRDALGQVDAKMVELFHGDPERVGRELDAIKGNARLLDAPKKR